MPVTHCTLLVTHSTSTHCRFLQPRCFLMNASMLRRWRVKGVRFFRSSELVLRNDGSVFIFNFESRVGRTTLTLDFSLTYRECRFLMLVSTCDPECNTLASHQLLHASSVQIELHAVSRLKSVCCWTFIERGVWLAAKKHQFFKNSNILNRRRIVASEFTRVKSLSWLSDPMTKSSISYHVGPVFQRKVTMTLRF
jgi:hypothetical protein